MADQTSPTPGGQKRSGPWAIAQWALELLASHGCQPSPKAYEVFFAYASGDEEVRNAVDHAARTDHLLTSFDLDQIHHDHFRTNDGEWEQQQRASHKVEASLGDAVTDLEVHLKVGQDYGRKLERASGQLGKTNSAEDLSGLIQGLISDTGEVRDATAKMQNNLVFTRDFVSQVTADVASTRREGNKDLLTGLTGRRGFDILLESEIQRALKDGRQLMLCMMALDGFEAVNAKYGRKNADLVLRSVGRLMARYAEGGEIAARLSGAKFGLLIHGSSLREAFGLAETLRKDLLERDYSTSGIEIETGQVTGSLGISVLTSGDSAEAIIDRAGECVERARASGGNAVAAENEHVF